ncbi:hypothetical protein [Planomonospora parontospora]|uniref:hypothetical protein n=1 Tax=Planomonospora parontospora TaxID=58119 RepID=UPI00167070D4|nr:hypothetical protein [Planomonospora parontospora]GGL14323.1 hypothetical protein GCM10014719_15410 [Planomonospora parontospora subsp. antibiotica]GII17843.1 hypothetical protein Ppa05_45690 [Planomonospora parontospora subsp. antibiotica]
MNAPGPDLAALREAVAEFARFAGPERSWQHLLRETAPALDLSVPAHPRALLAWLNSWGCRLRNPRPGEPDVFGASVAAWWSRWAAHLPGPDACLARLTDAEIDRLGLCYADLAAAPATAGARPRSLGSTAASKALHALRPRAVMPWDAAIAERLHGARTPASYAAHLRLGREWALGVLAESGLGEEALAAELGRPGRPLTKMLDDYCYLTFSVL